MYNEQVVANTAAYVQQTLDGEGSGHDWWHIYRVWHMAKRLAQEEHADLYVVELAALLHDIADHKFHGGDLTVGPRIAREWLEQQHVDKRVIEHVCDIIETSSFKGAHVKSSMKTLEGMVVQDADRLDAIGAIGVARTFAFGGTKHRPLYDPRIKPQLHDTFEAYSNATSPTINHFYEKLLLLKDLMNTQTAKTIAQQRHEYMQAFLEEFYSEWEGRA